MAAKENARVQGGRKVTTDQEMELAEAHGINDAARRPADKPSFEYNVGPYIRSGLTLLPLHRHDATDARGRQRGKSPRDGAWQAKDYDSRAVVERAARDGTNVGVRLSPGWLVLDVDPRNFPEGRDPLAELVRDLSLDLSQAPHTVTGSGGHHYWFTKPTDVQLLDSLEDYPGVEFKSHGRQVVAAGSVHPCGHPRQYRHHLRTQQQHQHVQPQRIHHRQQRQQIRIAGQHDHQRSTQHGHQAAPGGHGGPVQQSADQAHGIPCALCHLRESSSGPIGRTGCRSTVFNRAAAVLRGSLR